MPLVGAAAVAGAGAIAGAKISANASNRASQAQQKATADALAYERENQANRTARYDAAMADYQKRYDAWLQQFYGVKPAPSTGGGVRASSAGMGAPSAPAGAAGLTPGYGTPGGSRGNTIAQLILAQGQEQANAANQSGDIWGSALAGIGQNIGAAIKNRPPTPPTQPGPVQLTPAEVGAVQPWRPPEQTGWNNWQNYLGQGLAPR